MEIPASSRLFYFPLLFFKGHVQIAVYAHSAILTDFACGCEVRESDCGHVSVGSLFEFVRRDETDLLANIGLKSGMV